MKRTAHDYQNQQSNHQTPQTAVTQPTTWQSTSQDRATPTALPRPQAVLQRALADPSQLSAAEVNVLQRTIGLRAAQRMLGIPSADALNRSLNAKVFTTGNDIFFGQVWYNPGNSGGQELIVHELTHTVQQDAARVQREATQPANGESNSPLVETTTEELESTVQREIGFEVETGIPITQIKTEKGTGRKHYFNVFAGQHRITMSGGIMPPDHDSIKRTAPEPDNEHFDNDLPIVAFVNDAIDEDLTDEEFSTWAAKGSGA